MGKSTISMAIFNSYFDITRGYISPITSQIPVGCYCRLSTPSHKCCCVVPCFVSGLELGHVQVLCLQDITHVFCTWSICGIIESKSYVLVFPKNGCPQLILKSWLFVYSTMAIGFRTRHGALCLPSPIGARYWGASELIGWVSWPGIYRGCPRRWRIGCRQFEFFPLLDFLLPIGSMYYIW